MVAVYQGESVVLNDVRQMSGQAERSVAAMRAAFLAAQWSDGGQRMTQ